MDALATCPLTKDSIARLYDSINVVLSPIINEFIVTVEHSDELQCCRIKTLSQSDYEQIQDINLGRTTKQREDDFNVMMNCQRKFFMTYLMWSRNL